MKGGGQTWMGFNWYEEFFFARWWKNVFYKLTHLPRHGGRFGMVMDNVGGGETVVLLPLGMVGCCLWEEVFWCNERHD